MRTWCLVALLVLSAMPAAARAERTASGGNIVHSRRAAVVAHRMVPPFYGRHVYQGRSRR
ncbi:MAG: hypothetical protein U0939_21025 [Pirellulales bacterium]